jgi:hypothetical protein
VRSYLAWTSVAILAAACFAPWTEVTTFRSGSVEFGAMNEYSSGAMYVLACAAGATLGLLTRTRWLTATSGTVAALFTLLVMYESPGTMLQFGYEAHVASGAYLALATAVALVVVARPRAPRAPFESRVELESPR